MARGRRVCLLAILAGALSTGVGSAAGAGIPLSEKAVDLGDIEKTDEFAPAIITAAGIFGLLGGGVGGAFLGGCLTPKDQSNRDD